MIWWWWFDGDDLMMIIWVWLFRMTIDNDGWRWWFGDDFKMMIWWWPFEDGGDDYDGWWRIMIDESRIEILKSLHHEVRIGNLRL